MDVVKHFGLSQDPFRTPEPGSIAGEALSAEAARAYLAGRAAGAGGRELFSPSALDLLAEASQGDPDKLRQLGGNALFHAAFDGAARVEDVHARQAATTQGLWVPTEDPMRTAPVVAPVSAAVHTIGAERVVEEAPPAIAVPRHLRWWRRTPPLTRLAIVVGALLLSLPIVGYVIGAIKDARASAESSYLPEDPVAIEAEKSVPGIDAGDVAINPDAAEPVQTATSEPLPPARPPVDLMPQREPAPIERSARESEPAFEPAAEPVPASEPVPSSEPVPAEEPAPAPEIETVPIEAPPVDAPAEEPTEPQ